MTLLSIKNLTIDFPSRHALTRAVDNVSLELEAGEILGLVGESGAGKSTVGNGIVQLISSPGQITGGQVYLAGELIADFDCKPVFNIRGSRIGFIFQDPMTSLNPLFTIENQIVESFADNLGMNERDAHCHAVGLLWQVGIAQPEVRIKQYPHQFSVGMRQRVVIAIALAREPKLLIADEPTTALDVSVQHEILSLIRDLCKEKGLGCLMITHDMGVIANVTDRVAVMYRGKLVEIGDTTEILRNPRHAYSQSLIGAVPPSNFKIKRFPLVEYIEATDKSLKQIDVTSHWLGQGQRHASHDDLLVVNGLNLWFVVHDAIFECNRRYLKAVHDVNFVIKQGETFGLVGESGSGKSTIARIVSGLQRPDTGSITFDGTELTGKPDKTMLREARKQMQMVFQNPYSSLNGRMRIDEIIAEPILFHQLASPAEVSGIVGDLLDHVGLGRRCGRKYPHEFSGGQRQRISIARALASRPRLLICDEPTSALDVSVQAQILNLLKDIQDELGLSMLFISHDLPVIRQMCDRVAIMRQGEILEITDSAQFFESPQHAYSAELLKLMPQFGTIYP